MVNYITDNVGVVKNGSKQVFKGIIRGAGYVPVTYIYDRIEDLEFLNLEEWIYYTK